MRRKEPKLTINNKNMGCINDDIDRFTDVKCITIGSPTNVIKDVTDRMLSITITGPRSHKSKSNNALLPICSFDIIFPSRA
ncbi:hypothetical protein GCM10023261_13260 [Bartonella jaculi]|uniref:Uncharacterized protein n=1 Tax=Bartonella jaculi TaxID=686226 RepID=A0ABP9NAK0_9HYPH